MEVSACLYAQNFFSSITLYTLEDSIVGIFTTHESLGTVKTFIRSPRKISLVSKNYANWLLYPLFTPVLVMLLMAFYLTSN